jgi:hypothetical protein
MSSEDPKEGRQRREILTGSDKISPFGRNDNAALVRLLPPVGMTLAALIRFLASPFDGSTSLPQASSRRARNDILTSIRFRASSFVGTSTADGKRGCRLPPPSIPDDERRTHNLDSSKEYVIESRRRSPHKH